MHKEADVVFSVAAGSSYWPLSMHEPLTVALVFPFARCAPWQLKGTPKMLEMGRRLSRVQENESLEGWDLLRSFFAKFSRIATVPGDVVPKLLYF